VLRGSGPARGSISISPAPWQWSDPNRKWPRGGKENRYAIAGSQGLSTVLHCHVPTAPRRRAVLRWPLCSPSMAVAEPKDSGASSVRVQPATAAASPCLLHVPTEQGLSVSGSTPGLCSPLSVLLAHGMVPSDREDGQPSSPVTLAGHPFLLAVREA